MMQASQLNRSTPLTVIMASAGFAFAASATGVDAASPASAAGPAEAHTSTHSTAPWASRTIAGTERAETCVSATGAAIKSPADAEPEAAGKTNPR